MGKYAICFEHKIFAENNKKSIKEYFIPYQPNALVGIVQNPTLTKKLKQAAEEKRTFDEFVERHNLQNKDYIGIIPENEDSDNPWWINDDTRMEENSLWDYLTDVRTVVDAVRFGQNSAEKVNDRANRTMISRLAFERLKMIISIYIYLDESHSPDDIAGFASKMYSNDIEPLIEIYRMSRRLEYEDLDYLRVRVRDYLDKTENLSNSENNQAYIWVKEMDVILEGGTGKNYSLLKSRLKVLSNMFIKSLGGEFEKQYRYVKKIVSLIPKSRMDNREFKTLYSLEANMLEMSINERQLYRDIPMILEELIQYEVKEQLSINDCAPDSENFEIFSRSFNEDMKNILKGNCGKKIIKKYMSCGNGCFAILVTKSNKRYFAFSGREEINLKRKKQTEVLAKYIMENVLGVGSTVDDVYMQGYNYNWSPLNENTVRYTEILDDGKEKPEKYIFIPKVLGNDFGLNKQLKSTDLQKIGYTFGCCERKMLGYLGTDTVRAIYSRWAPCWKCRPAVYALGPCDFFAFAESSDVGEDKVKLMKLKSYKITKKIEYDVE